MKEPTIRVNEEWGIGADELNFLVMRRVVAGDDAKEPGKESWKTVAYYNVIAGGGRDSGLALALHHIADLAVFEVKPGAKKTVGDIVRMQQGIHDSIQEIKGHLSQLILAAQK